MALNSTTEGANTILGGIVESVKPYIPNIAFILIVIILAFFADKVTEMVYKRIREKLHLKRSPLGKTVIKIFIYFIAVVLILLSIPGMSGDLIQIFGLVIGGVIAFSSSTIIANGMSGILVKGLKQYRIGDIVEFEGDIGSVSEIGLFHTEIQTVKRQLLTIPNNVMFSRKFSNLSETGVIITAAISLGYDIPRTRVEEVIGKAAKTVGLQQPYVSVTELGDYSIKYEVNGLLMDAGRIIGTSSQLKKEILDECSKADIEIVSPTFINMRSLKPSQRFVAKYVAEETTKELEERGEAVESIMFVKAEKERMKVQEKEKKMSEIDTLLRRAKELEQVMKTIKNRKLKERLGKRRELILKKIEEIEKELRETKEAPPLPAKNK